jgi:hypothetical protein
MVDKGRRKNTPDAIAGNKAIRIMASCSHFRKAI